VDDVAVVALSDVRSIARSLAVDERGKFDQRPELIELELDVEQDLDRLDPVPAPRERARRPAKP
jgi:hypothetical protein